MQCNWVVVWTIQRDGEMEKKKKKRIVITPEITRDIDVLLIRRLMISVWEHSFWRFSVILKQTKLKLFRWMYHGLTELLLGVNLRD